MSPTRKGRGGGAGKKKKAAAQQVSFTVDCCAPVQDSIMDPAQLEKFFVDRIKVDNKIGNLGDRVTVHRDRATIRITAQLPFAKRYLKYLTKKYLKKHQLRDYLRVLASDRTTYQLRYFEMHQVADQED